MGKKRSKSSKLQVVDQESAAFLLVDQESAAFLQLKRDIEEHALFNKQMRTWISGETLLGNYNAEVEKLNTATAQKQDKIATMTMPQDMRQIKQRIKLVEQSYNKILTNFNALYPNKEKSIQEQSDSQNGLLQRIEAYYSKYQDDKLLSYLSDIQYSYGLVICYIRKYDTGSYQDSLDAAMAIKIQVDTGITYAPSYCMTKVMQIQTDAREAEKLSTLKQSFERKIDINFDTPIDLSKCTRSLLIQTQEKILRYLVEVAGDIAQGAIDYFYLIEDALEKYENINHLENCNRYIFILIIQLASNDNEGAIKTFSRLTNALRTIEPHNSTNTELLESIEMCSMGLISRGIIKNDLTDIENYTPYLREETVTLLENIRSLAEGQLPDGVHDVYVKERSSTADTITILQDGVTLDTLLEDSDTDSASSSVDDALSFTQEIVAISQDDIHLTSASADTNLHRYTKTQFTELAKLKTQWYKSAKMQKIPHSWHVKNNNYVFKETDCNVIDISDETHKKHYAAIDDSISTDEFKAALGKGFIYKEFRVNGIKFLSKKNGYELKINGDHRALCTKYINEDGDSLLFFHTSVTHTNVKHAKQQIYQTNSVYQYGKMQFVDFASDCFKKISTAFSMPEATDMDSACADHPNSACACAGDMLHPESDNSGY